MGHSLFGRVTEKENSYEEENNDADVVVGTNSTTSQMDSATRKDGEKTTKSKKAKNCFAQNCNKEAVMWPFPDTKRGSRTMIGYCIDCNTKRKENECVKRKESRINISDNHGRKALYGWLQEAPVCFHECKGMPGYTADRVKLGFFSRDLSHAFVSAGRMMLGKDSTMTNIEANKA